MGSKPSGNLAGHKCHKQPGLVGPLLQSTASTYAQEPCPRDSTHRSPAASSTCLTLLLNSLDSGFYRHVGTANPASFFCTRPPLRRWSVRRAGRRQHQHRQRSGPGASLRSTYGWTGPASSMTPASSASGRASAAAAAPPGASTQVGRTDVTSRSQPLAMPAAQTASGQWELPPCAWSRRGSAISMHTSYNPMHAHHACSLRRMRLHSDMRVWHTPAAWGRPGKDGRPGVAAMGHARPPSGAHGS